MTDRLFIDDLVDGFTALGREPALVVHDETVTYEALSEQIARWIEILGHHGIRPGMVVTLVGDYGLAQIAALVALIRHRAIVSPISKKAYETSDAYLTIAQADAAVVFDDQGGWRIDRLPPGAATPHPLLETVRAEGHPGLILFSSGSTGAPKAILLDLERLLQKFRKRRSAMRTLVFLLLDHIGGINTLFAVLSQGGVIITPSSRQPDAVAAAIATHKAQLLPTTPTFLKMLMISGAWQAHDLSSLEVITYGTEPMPESTLAAVSKALPHVVLKQTYGLSEVGILSTKSKSSDSTLVKIGGAGFAYKIVDNILWIKSDAAMLGYLNYETIFEDDGWYNTGDLVEIHGDYLRILGRKSELINVGGEKVHPNEVESVLLSDPNVAEATVAGKSNPVMGQIVTAAVRLIDEEDHGRITNRLRALCRARLDAYKVPMLFTISDTPLHGERFKKIRTKAEA